MSADKMHAGEVDAGVFLVARLISSQFPWRADLPIAPVCFAGTDNAIYRLGDEMAVRLADIHWATGQADKECQRLPKLAPPVQRA